MSEEDDKLVEVVEKELSLPTPEPLFEMIESGEMYFTSITTDYGDSGVVVVEDKVVFEDALIVKVEDKLARVAPSIRRVYSPVFDLSGNLLENVPGIPEDEEL